MSNNIINSELWSILKKPEIKYSCWRWIILAIFYGYSYGIKLRPYSSEENMKKKMEITYKMSFETYG